MVNRRTEAAALQLTEATDIIAQQQLIDARDLGRARYSNEMVTLIHRCFTERSKHQTPVRIPGPSSSGRTRRRLESNFFGWLLSQGRIQCKANLARKGIVDSLECDVCHGAEETPAHIIFGCTAAREFWESIQITTDPSWAVLKLQEITAPVHIPAKHFQTFLLLCCWHIWKRCGGTTSSSGTIVLQFKGH
jgi:hypothetical protein